MEGVKEGKHVSKIDEVREPLEEVLNTVGLGDVLETLTIMLAVELIPLERIEFAEFVHGNKLREQGYWDFRIGPAEYSVGFVEVEFPIPTPTQLVTPSPTPFPTPFSSLTPTLPPTPSTTPKQRSRYIEYGLWIAVIVIAFIIVSSYLYVRRRQRREVYSPQRL